MDTNNKYLELFIDEGQEHLQTMNEKLMELESDPQNLEIVTVIFRSAHTIKGMSASMGFEELADLTHIMENVLDGIRNEEFGITESVMDALFESVDYLEDMVLDIANGGDGKKEVGEIVGKLEFIVRQDTQPATSDAPSITASEEMASAIRSGGYQVDVFFVDSCALKSVRAYMVYQEMEALGTVDSTVPTVDELNAGVNLERFRLHVQTEATPETLEKAIRSVGEIAECQVVRQGTDAPAPVVLNEFEAAVLEKAKAEGFYTWRVQASIKETCDVQAVRMTQVFECLEPHGDIVYANPSVDQIQEGDVQHELLLLYVTKINHDLVENLIKGIGDMEMVSVRDFFAKEETLAPIPVKKSVEKPAKPEPAVQKKTLNRTIRVSLDRIDELMNLFEELVIDRGRLGQISEELNHTDLTETYERMSRTSGNLQDVILNMRMVPIDTVFNRYPRMVRNLAKDLGKKIELEIQGAETEMDRNVIDEIGDPLVHLIRNSLDHGVESPEERLAKGKDETGTVVLRAYHSGNQVFIEIQDDGAGINREKVLKKAIDKGIVDPEKAAGMPDEDVYQLIFSSGFSTAEKVSDVSGRGVGLDVVRTAIESLGGHVTVTSREGEGSTFSIELPLTLSIISSMLVEVQDEKFAIPLTSIIETSIIDSSKILTSQNKKVINFRGKIIPLVFLDEMFDIPLDELREDQYGIVIVKKGDRSAALVVDNFIGQQEIVLKSLGDYLKNVFAISGATILGDGQVALIVDCNALIY